MKTIDTLIEDIGTYLNNPTGVNEVDLAGQFASVLRQRLEPADPAVPSPPARGTLRFSNVGTRCGRKLWYQVNTPQLAEPVHPHTRLKFLYGDLLEALLLELARYAGHNVTGLQTKLDVGGVKGHRDAVIDGMVVDCKSASPSSFNAFKLHLSPSYDAFGYLWQLRSYLYASRNDPAVTEKNKAAFFVINKTTGNICLDVHEFTDEELEEVPLHFERSKELVASETEPERGYEEVDVGKSGNKGLSTFCSYCPFKQTCWPTLQTYIYSNGPVYLTTVVREPNVPKVGELF